jgi:preprotein translocase subunit SecE
VARSRPDPRPELEDETPGSIRHATPDVEIAEAQMSLGRPDLGDADPAIADSSEIDMDDPSEPELDEAEFEELEDEVDETEAEAEIAAGERSHGLSLRGRRSDASADGAELVAHGEAHPEHRGRAGSRLVNFLRGSWRELQRVQWPDRRQVVQATSVVIGFVIVAGVFLGVADLISTKIMNFILK